MSSRQVRAAVLRSAPGVRPYDRTRPLEIVDLGLTPPGPSEVLLRIEAAGVCHSDLSVIDGNRPRPVPMALGHEAAGRVVEVGAAVSHLREGQRVVVTFLPRCGDCSGCATDGLLPCVPGSAANGAGELLGGGRRLRDARGPVHHHLGASAFATHAVVDARSLVAVEDDVPADVAAVLGCAVLTGGGAVVNGGRPREGESVAVVGLGGVGLAALIVARALGLGEVIGVDPHPGKLDLAATLGADRVLTPEEARGLGVRAAVVVESAGVASAFETAFEITGPGGRTVTAGLPGPATRASISPLTITAEARTIVGSYLGSAVPDRDIPTYVDLWRSGRLPVERLISHRLPLEDVNLAMERLAAGDAVRQVIEFPA